MNENGKFERIDEENERKRKCVETEEIHQINLIILPIHSLSDDLWLIWSNEWSWDRNESILYQHRSNRAFQREFRSKIFII